MNQAIETLDEMIRTMTADGVLNPGSDYTKALAEVRRLAELGAAVADIVENTGDLTLMFDGLEMFKAAIELPEERGTVESEEFVSLPTAINAALAAAREPQP